jgi:Transposase DDE domain/Transposase domain (DUF772)
LLSVIALYPFIHKGCEGFAGTTRYQHMNQISLSQTGFELSAKRTRKRVFLDEMQRIIPWSILVGLIAKHAPSGVSGRPPFPVPVMLRIHFMQQWFGLSDPPMKEALHGEEKLVFADSGYRGVTKRDEIKEQTHQPEWHVAMMSSKRKQLDKGTQLGALYEELEKIKASARAKVEHPFQVIKCQWHYRKTRYKGLFKNTMQIVTLFALSNLWMARRSLMSQSLRAQG